MPAIVAINCNEYAYQSNQTRPKEISSDEINIDEISERKSDWREMWWWETTHLFSYERNQSKNQNLAAATEPRMVADEYHLKPYQSGNQSEVIWYENALPCVLTKLGRTCRGGNPANNEANGTQNNVKET